jgi:hypothetical protein
VGGSKKFQSSWSGIIVGGHVQKVEIGQHYKEESARSIIWIVAEEAPRSGSIRHLRILKLNDPTTIKLISDRALADRKLYRLIELQ